MLKRPATELAREAIDVWLAQMQREATTRAITDYATAQSGTNDDIDETLEQATLDHLDDESGEQR